MNSISQSVPKRDHLDKITGKIKYTGDLFPENGLTARILRSSKAHANITDVAVPDLPEGYIYLDHTDVPGLNQVHMVLDDTPVFSEGEVKYIGDPIGMVVGPDPETVDRLLSEIVVKYEDLPVVNDPDQSDHAFFDYNYGKGSLDEGFRDADLVFEESFYTGAQEQAYLETQAMIAEPDPETGGVYVHGSMQCPFYLVTALEAMMGLDAGKIRVKQEATGGGFGGKEDYPSVLACQTAMAAMKTGRPVKIVFSREEDMTVTSKKHPSKMTFKGGIKDGKLCALDIDICYDAGAYSTLSMVVLQRGIITAPGVYKCDNLHVHGNAVRTNVVPFGAYRGFGGTQAMFGMERFMDHFAEKAGLDPVAFKLNNAAVQGDGTSTSGIYHFHVPIPEMADQVMDAADYKAKHDEYSKPQSGRYRKGIGLAFCFHGDGFTGNGERDMIKAVVELQKDMDNKVHILVSSTDMGQGFLTSLPKIAAKELGIPLEDIYYELPDTSIVPDSGPTVASRSMMVVGELVRKASIRLKDEWIDGENISVIQHYEHPDFMIPFDINTFHGDAYPTFSWGAYIVEVSVDTLTGVVDLPGVWASFDVGTPIDLNILTGQMEGGLLQSIGYSSMEQIPYDSGCRIRNNSFSDYLLPTAADVPNMHVMFCSAEYPDGPYGAKGAGELPAVGAPSAYLAAVEQALGGKDDLTHIPLTAEDVLESLGRQS
ncbi:MAG: xanthine dehydrogenase family protein molybdopterin-binding subunit [Eubacteriaceae bacterium]|jgi:CO/xanthine dehydrogenase Mo-binding subunit